MIHQTTDEVADRVRQLGGLRPRRAAVSRAI